MAIGCANSILSIVADLLKQSNKKKTIYKIYSWKYPQRTDKVEQYTGEIV